MSGRRVLRAGGAGFLRSVVRSRTSGLRDAIAFLEEAITRKERVTRYLDQNPKYRVKG